MVHSICSSFWLLTDESRDLSQAEKKITVARAEQNKKNGNYFLLKWQLLTVLSENNCYFENLLSSSSSNSNLSLRYRLIIMRSL